MPWVITATVDVDKSNPSVGEAKAVFTDTDGTIFTFVKRDTLTNAAATAFVTAALAARDAWRAQKTRESNVVTTLVTGFTTAGETATAGPVI